MIEQCRKQLEESLIERDFLSRFNKNLRNECESLTKEILQLKSSVKINQERREKISATNSSSEDLHKVYRSSSSEVMLSRRRDKRKR